MKTNHCKLLQLSTLSVLTLLAFTTPSIAEKIYHWKDETGKTHYTNNPALVPLDSNNTHIIKMIALPTPLPVEPPIDGKALWENMCSTCHVLSARGSNNRRGMSKLVNAINDPSTTPTLDIIILQAAIDDEMDDFEKIDLTPDEIQAVATYIRQKITQHPSSPEAQIPTQESPEQN